MVGWKFEWKWKVCFEAYEEEAGYQIRENEGGEEGKRRGREEKDGQKLNLC